MAFYRKIKNGPSKQGASKAHISSDFQGLGCGKFFYQYGDFHFWLDTAESEAEGTDELQDVERLRKYLTRNWTYVEPLNQRQMPEKIHLIQPGACEAGHRIYSYRMKHQGRCWSQEGAEAMVTAHHSHEKRRMGCRVWPQAHQPVI